jgi:hypothetical protein
MPWRHRRSIKILPGVRVNIGKHGITSTTYGGKHFHVTRGKRGTRETVSSVRNRSPAAAWACSPSRCWC